LGCALAEAGGTAMNGWCDFTCDFPDDGNATLDRVLNAMPAGSCGALTHTPIPYFRLRLSSPGAAASLAISVNGVRQIRGFTDNFEVLVPWSARSFCEQQIIALNHGTVRWTQLDRIEATKEVWIVFERLWQG
jgi:hypothetical protein